MALDDLRAELEKLYQLEELIELSRDLIGLDPARVGGSAAKASFAKALIGACAAEDALEALADAVVMQRGEQAPRFTELRQHGFDRAEELESGDSLGHFLVLRKLGGGRAGISYLARADGRDVRLKVLRQRVTLAKSGLLRFLTATRLHATLRHPGLPSGIWAGAVDSRWLVTHDPVEGEPLSERLARTGPIPFLELSGLLRNILDPLAQLHARRLAHGNLCLENLVVADHGSDSQVVLLDAGTALLQAPSGAADGFPSLGSAKTLSPEQIRGRPADARSDVYAFAALLYELLTGRAPFADSKRVDVLVGHLDRTPEPPSTSAQPGTVSRELDELILRMLDKDPARRPRDAAQVLGAIEALDRAGFVQVGAMPDDELDTLLQALIAAPEDEHAARELEAAVAGGADPRRVAEAFRFVADLAADSDRAAQQRLLRSAARIYDGAALDRVTAEQLYSRLLELDPSDHAAEEALLRLRRQLGKWTDVVEMLLERSERATMPRARARILAELGKLYAVELDDPEQALIAYTESFCQDPQQTAYAAEVEKLAGTSQEAWSEALELCVQSTAGDMPADKKNLLLVRMAQWYADKVKRPDLALSCYAAVLSTDPKHDPALAGMSALYRTAQRWSELGSVLITRADATDDPSLARDLRAEAASILEQQLSQVAAARDLYERILTEDPSHEGAGEALTKSYESAGDPQGTLRVLERRADAVRGEPRHALLCRAAELFEGQLGDLAEASRRYQLVLSEDPAHQGALRGLERVFGNTGEYDELLRVLEQQLTLAVTPRQKILLWERIARIHAEEFLDHARAAAAWEQVLELDARHQGAFAALPRHYRALERLDDLAALYQRQLRTVSAPRERIELSLALGGVLSGALDKPELAISAYEEVLELQPEHPAALEALAELRASAGDASRALEALEALAAAAVTPAARADHYKRAARLLEERGELDLAIDRYKLALDANPDDAAASAALRAAYVARGDAKAAVELLEREIAATEGARARAKLLGEMARLSWELLGDEQRAEQAARRAIGDDPTNLEALTVLGDLAFNASHFLEAATQYEQVTNRLEGLARSEAIRVVARQAEALARSGSPDKALTKAEWLLRMPGRDPQITRLAADLIFTHGDPQRAFELYSGLVSDGEQLGERDQAPILYGLGESARRLGRLEAARVALQESIERDSTSPLAYRALAKVFEAEQRWEDMARVLYRQLDLVSGEERVTLLIELGELAGSKLGDATYAAKMFLAALYESPNDRKVLMKLMQLYSDAEDWNQLLEVIHKLADLVEDDKQKSKYLKTAGEIAAKQLHDPEQAVQLLDRAVALDPSSISAIDEALRQHRMLGNVQSVKQLLKQRIKLSVEAKDSGKALDNMAELAELYLNEFSDIAQAVAVYEAMQELDSGNVARTELLAQLYASRPDIYFDKAIATYQVVLKSDPYRAETYRALRRVYTQARFPDGAWCLCQALSMLQLANGDERRFFERLRSESEAPARQALGDGDWLSLVAHPDTDPVITNILTLIEPAVIAVRSKSWQELGYLQEHIVDPARYPYGLVQTLAWAAQVLSMELPPLFENRNDPGGLSFLHATTPSLVLGRAALQSDVGGQTAAFIAGQQLTHLRPAYYVRQLLPTGTALKSWLLAAVKLVRPHFPVASELERPIKEALAALETALTGIYRDHLASNVSRLLQHSASLDLRKWVAAADLTADRAGFILCHDLETAVELVRASRGDSSAVPVAERIQELVLYSVSTQYFRVREQLGVNVETMG